MNSPRFLECLRFVFGAIANAILNCNQCNSEVQSLQWDSHCHSKRAIRPPAFRVRNRSRYPLIQRDSHVWDPFAAQNFFPEPALIARIGGI